MLPEMLTTLNTECNRLLEQFPDARARISNARAMVIEQYDTVTEERKYNFTVYDNNTVLVTNESTGESYHTKTVESDRNCTCPDVKQNGVINCKHKLAVVLLGKLCFFDNQGAQASLNRTVQQRRARVNKQTIERAQDAPISIFSSSAAEVAGNMAYDLATNEYTVLSKLMSYDGKLYSLTLEYYRKADE